jgi:protein subunit release factor B
MEEGRQRIHLVTKKDLDISYFCGSGAGGQKRNKTASGVQICHRASGAIGRASDTRSQDQNKQAAFSRMRQTAKFKVWLSKKLFEIREHEKIEDAVERDMAPENLKIEVKDEEGKWLEVSSDYFDKL